MRLTSILTNSEKKVKAPKEEIDTTIGKRMIEIDVQTITMNLMTTNGMDMDLMNEMVVELMVNIDVMDPMQEIDVINMNLIDRINLMDLILETEEMNFNLIDEIDLLAKDQVQILEVVAEVGLRSLTTHLRQEDHKNISENHQQTEKDKEDTEEILITKMI